VVVRPERRAGRAGGKILFRRGKGEEQVLLPLGRARYQVTTSWDRTVVILNGDGVEAIARGDVVADGKVVAGISLRKLRYGSVRAVVELSRPATPSVAVIQHQGRSTLRLTYLR
jgi:hypothetical protein